MERFTNFFELHLGFPIGDNGDRDANKMLSRLGAESRDWSRSEVRSVHLTEPGCMDPHSVPGTLGWLVSRKIHRAHQSWDATVEREVLPSCARAIEHLASLGILDARLEIAFPFGCLVATVEGDRVTRSAWAEDPVSIDSERLRFPFGTMLERAPEWEIHIQLERILGTHSPLLVGDVAGFLARYGLVVEQTIEYRSQAMIDGGRNDYHLIATSYGQSPQNDLRFRGPEATKKEAERVFYETQLCEDAAQHGYSARLILEHTIGCFRPITITRDSTLSSLFEVTCAI